MITSTKNPKIQWVRGLQSKSKERQAEQVIIIEGVRLLEEAQESNWVVRSIFYTETLSDRGMNLVNAYKDSETRLDTVSSNVMQAISDTKNPQGILAVIEMRSIPVPDQPDFLLILDGVRDPGNLGTIIRTAAAAGVQAVYLTPGTVDVFSPKVVRAGMGAHFRLPIHSASWIDICSRIKSANLHAFLATSESGDFYYDSDFQRALVLIIGGEAEGASKTAIQVSDSRLQIPMPGGGESLNASVAAGILLFEIAHQREKK
ncbi:MAG: RNA methyltransferase [Anaerolineales bacterium]|nr:RNA methyltransferase [Anaerolineales bacterium]